MYYALVSRYMTYNFLSCVNKEEKADFNNKTNYI